MLSSVIVVVSGQWLRVATQPYRRSRDGHPLWIAGLPTPDSVAVAAAATYPQLLHHQPGRDPGERGTMAARRGAEDGSRAAAGAGIDTWRAQQGIEQQGANPGREPATYPRTRRVARSRLSSIDDFQRGSLQGLPDLPPALEPRRALIVDLPQRPGDTQTSSTRNPLTPSWINSPAQPTGVETTGMPAARARTGNWAPPHFRGYHDAVEFLVVTG